MANSTLLRIGFTLAASLICAAPAAAETEEIPTRKLEAVWKTAVPGDSTVGHYYGPRLRIQSDNRISLAAGHALVTLDAAGKIRHRALLPHLKKEFYSSLPLEGGDFLFQPDPGASRQLRITRVSADGAVRFAAQERLPEGIVSIMHDAGLLPDGHVLAIASYGPGPNTVMALLVFDGAGRRVGDHRSVIFLPASEGLTRLYVQLRDRDLAGISVVGMGFRPPGPAPFRKLFSLTGAVPVGSETVFLGAESLKCSAVNAPGNAILGTSDAKGEDKRVTLRWYGGDGEQTASRALEDADSCQIATRRDGASLAWLAPRKLFAVNDDAKLLWRAELPEDAVAIGWMSDGDIVAVHPTGDGANIVRYIAH